MVAGAAFATATVPLRRTRCEGGGRTGMRRRRQRRPAAAAAEAAAAERVAPRELRVATTPAGGKRVRGTLDAAHGARLAYEVHGDGPNHAVVLHGGPGAGCFSRHAGFFGPEYTVVLLDQRGCGASRPLGGLEHNTTEQLVEDLELLRAHLDIDSWLLFGGSWGTTLALAYASRHPSRVWGMVMRGVCLLRRSEIDWVFREGGASALFPRQWDEFVGALPEDERTDPVAAYAARMCSPNASAGVRAAAVRAWGRWSMAVYSGLPRGDERNSASWDGNKWNPGGGGAFVEPQQIVGGGDTPEALPELSNVSGTVYSSGEAHALLECWYCANQGFDLRAEPLLERVAAGALDGIPAIAVQGRSDLVTPPRTAWDLHRAWPEMQLRVVDGGHSMYSPRVMDGLCQATDEMLRHAPREVAGGL